MIRWEVDATHPFPQFRGWCAFIGDRQVGKVYVDGAAWFDTEQIRVGSPAIAAEVLVRYWEGKHLARDVRHPLRLEVRMKAVQAAADDMGFDSSDALLGMLAAHGLCVVSTSERDALEAFKAGYNALEAMPTKDAWRGLVVRTVAALECWPKEDL